MGGDKNEGGDLQGEQVKQKLPDSILNYVPPPDEEIWWRKSEDKLAGFPEDCGQYPGNNSMPNPKWDK